MNPIAKEGCAMSFQEYLKFLTRMFVQYVETPKEERRQRKNPREAWSSRWFGAIPMSIKLLLRK
jgi:YqzE-like protein